MSAFGGFGGANAQNTGGGGLFGAQQQQQQQQQTQPNPFGAAQTQGTAQPVSSLFGGGAAQPLQAQATQPTLFGANTGNPAANTGAAPAAGGGGLFGGANPAGTTGGGLFAGTTTGGPTGGGGLFGNPNPGGTTGGGLFGGGTTGVATGGGLYGNTNTTNPTGGGLFGNPNPQQQQQQQQQQPAAPGGLFGGTATQNPAGGGGLFGNTGTTGGGLFGGTANTTGATTTGGGLFGNTGTAGGTTAGGGLFGNPNANQQQQQPAAGGGLFGSTTTQQPAAGGGLFGSAATQQPAAGGGLFGSTNTQAGATGGGLFGSTTTQPNATAGGLFGSTAPRPAGAGLFGSTAGNLFGGQQPQQQQQQQQQQPQQQQAGGLFGQSTANTNNTLFGNRTTLGTSAFGQPASTLGVSTLGASSLLSSRSNVSSNPNANDAQTQFSKLTESIEAIFNAWNPASPQCRFQHPFYNLVDPNQVSMYGRPSNVLSDATWEKAVQGNPDPSCFVPVVALGFDDIRERVEAQSKQADDHQQKLKDLKTRLETLSSRHSVSNVARLQRATTLQTQITHRLLQLIQHLHLMIPAVRSSAIRPEEEQLRGKLEEIEDELRKGRVKAKLNELWALLGAVNASIERGRGGSGEWAVVDEEGMAQIIQVLKDQQAGLAHLTKILKKGKSDMAIVMGQNQNSNEELQLKEGETLWNSTSTLRASALR
ncbi:hypothetical protein EST38_g4994 [Candolleomyces aberdarensis]|uniref:Nucleoporin Nup54 alpha-helical domain-containing protein n=1 Tax=Candolleomyces aberdarensis TaxID=2316362 RepID=A0A4Q2DNW8_9AGAR|nr:hypothetical protein EST38_g4994 [Candolleomyces aberdarensis]